MLKCCFPVHIIRPTQQNNREKRRKIKIKKIWKQGIGLVICLVMTFSIWMSVMAANEQEEVIFTESEIAAEETGRKIVSEILESSHQISLTDKIPLEELEKQFPEEVEVILSDNSSEMIPVTWLCECDYMNEEEESYVFEILLPDGYEMADTCSSTFILVTLEAYVEPEVYRVYEANPDATVTIDQYLGAERTLFIHFPSSSPSSYS